MMDLRTTQLSDEAIRDIVGRMVDDARQYVETTFGPIRATATDYYMGRPFGDEEEGRSQVVMTTVRDTVRKTLPSLMRIFAGSGEYAVEFKPRGPEDVAQSAQQTDYINYLFLQENQGTRILYDAFKDALVRKAGFVKWWPDAVERVERAIYSGVTESELSALETDEEVTLDVLETAEDGTSQVEVTRTSTATRIRVDSVPPEELSWSRDARRLEDATLVVHTTEVRVTDLLAMGYDRGTVESLIDGSTEPDATASREERARRFENATDPEEEQQDPMTRTVRLDEAYVLLAIDPDDPASRWKITLAGEHHVFLDKEPISHVPLAVFLYDPEPHTVVGLSQADDTMDLQRINSAVMRGTLDSLALAIEPNTEVVQDAVNIKDLLNPELGRLVRVTQPGMMREVAHRFVGADTLPVLQLLSEVREERTGKSKAAEGLNAEALQSSTREAVVGTLSARQEQTELLARLLAEGGMTTLFRGLLRTVIEHQNRLLVVRLRNTWVPIDPRAWHADKDVIVNVGLGLGLTDQKISTLQAIAQDQKEWYQALGPGNPMVSLHQIRETRAKIVALTGFRDPDPFYQAVSPQQEQQFAQAMSQKPDPSLLLAQAEMAKAEADKARVQVDIAIAERKIALAETQARLEDDRLRDEQAATLILKIRELEMKYHQTLNHDEIQAEVTMARAKLDADTRREVANLQRTRGNGAD